MANVYCPLGLQGVMNKGGLLKETDTGQTSAIVVVDCPSASESFNQSGWNLSSRAKV